MTGREKISDAIDQGLTAQKRGFGPMRSIGEIERPTLKTREASLLISSPAMIRVRRKPQVVKFCLTIRRILDDR
jgi:hypothetical protein